MATYTPNAFATQGAQVNALRNYTPNRFSGTGGPSTTSMAPHLSTPASERPYAADFSMLSNADPALMAEHVGEIPKFDAEKVWNYSPQTYSQKSAAYMAEPKVAAALAVLRNPPPKVGETKTSTGDSGEDVTLTWNGESWVPVGRGLSGGD